MMFRAAVFGWILATLGSPLALAVDDPAPELGEKVYREHCAACHEGGVAKAPHRTFLTMLSYHHLHDALTAGSMLSIGSQLAAVEVDAVSTFLSGQTPDDVVDHSSSAYCADAIVDTDAGSVLVSGWSQSKDNHRAFAADDTSINANTVPGLELRWAFGFPGSIQARSQPAVGYGHIFVGSADGRVYALDRDTGCIRWTFRANAEVRTAISIADHPEGPVLVFGDLLAHLYAVDVTTGTLRWKRKLDTHPSATATAAPAIHAGVVYAPVSALEVTSAAEPDYGCCTFRGSVRAIDLVSGEELWRYFTIADEPQPTRANNVGVMQYGPSGSPVWNTPSIDAELGMMFFGTGENYSSPADGSSDAIHAVRLTDGTPVWVAQMTPDDAWNMGCVVENRTNCPKENGPDLDFASSTALVDLPDVGTVVIAGQKSGTVHALRARDGKILWQTKAGRGGIQGGVHFGLAIAGDAVLTPISDYDDPRIPGEKGAPGLYALDVASGAYRWRWHAEDICAGRRGCSPGISAAVTAGPGIGIAGGMDGTLRIHDLASGNVIWSFDSVRDYPTVNGVPGFGGSFGGPGPVLADNLLIVNSGYGMYGHMPGNVLLVFGLGKEGATP